jgi:ABC-type uncharacterized transport system permease subunit
LILAALCVALPARMGLVIIGGEGAILLGGLAAAIVGVELSSLPSPISVFALLLVGAVIGSL